MNTRVATLGPVAQTFGAFARNWLTICQLALVVLVTHLYQIEGEPFFKVIVLTALGFVASLALPLTQRQPLFVGLSIAAILWVLGWADGLWLMALGLVLIGLSRVPGSLPLRTAFLIVVGATFAVLRAGLGETPWSAAVWPILGSMFMFRTVLYVRAINSGQADKSWQGALAYFFMLPNVAFPLFPVVDYQTFRRTHFDRPETQIYEQGMLWIARGIFQLVLYRFVYHNVLNDPADVTRLSDLIRWMLGTFLLYLRVSGQFHLIVGLLHLFGYRLPETHKLYYLAHSFTELWRRINIYWTDFMMKVVFYPTYFKVKKRGPAAALVIATSAVFFTTWILHSYQWFWLRGGFPLTVPDVLFWGILGALVVRGALRELKGAKAPKRPGGWSWRLGLNAAVTFSVFCFLWSLWSTESIGQWAWTMSAAAKVDAMGIGLLLGVFGVVFYLGGRDWDARVESGGLAAFIRSPITRTVAPLLLLLAVAQPVVHDLAPGRASTMLASLRSTGLNEQDAARRHRGYYEQLDVRGSVNAFADRAPAGWHSPSEAGIIRERTDIVSRDLHPSLQIEWNGKPFSTNRWGMRDQEYSQEKPAGTLRVALMGPSHVMGNGVADGETFEALVETRLNRELRLPNYERIEILNFGVDGFTLPQELALLQERALSFQPDVVLFTQYHRGRVMTDRYLSKIVATGAAVPDPELAAILGRAGLLGAGQGEFPIPFEWARRIARVAGINPRVPHSEVQARVRSVSEEVNDWSIGRIAALARHHRAQPVMLALNAVIDDVPTSIPNLAAVEEAQVPVIDLFGVFDGQDPEALRVAPWDEHPNAQGHLLIADRLYEPLAQHLVQIAGSPVTDQAPPATATEGDL